MRLKNENSPLEKKSIVCTSIDIDSFPPAGVRGRNNNFDGTTTSGPLLSQLQGLSQWSSFATNEGVARSSADAVLSQPGSDTRILSDGAASIDADGGLIYPTTTMMTASSSTSGAPIHFTNCTFSGALSFS